MSSIKVILGGLFFFCFSYGAVAQETGLELLTLGPGSKALGLNEAVTAELLGASNLYSNPANLALEQSSSLDADYTLWVGDLTHTNAGINFRKGPRALAFGFLGSQADDIQLRGDQAGPAEGTFNISFLSLSSGYAYKIGPLALGGTIQYLREEYYVNNASGYAVNFGAASQVWNDRVTLGASLLNWGKMNELRSQSTPLPTSFRTGFDAEILTFTPPNNENLPVVLSLKNDWIFPVKTPNNTTQSDSGKNPYTNIAVEFEIAHTILLRSGYKSGDTVRPWSAGVGIDMGSILVNYAMIPFETGYGTVHSMGISYRF